jgi:nucleotide-binding universal stress UspA family protein
MLLPLDGTPDAEEVLDPAMRLGSLYEADYSLLTLIVSSEFDTPAKAAHVLQHGRMTTEDYLTQVKNRLQQRSLSASAKVVLTEKSVASTILRQAEATRADCIAMTLGRRSGLKRLFQPSVTRRVIERSSVPVLVV